ncbi:MAG: TrkA C-terminal domain-containing protein [Desulfomicrobium sp.]|nr:TrkA C-terminal domain-containing protein [Desulfomicrobium sp.]
MELLHNPIFLLLAVILSGHLLGKVKILSFSLGSSGIVFTGLLAGFAGFSLPGVIQSLGLVLFIYSVGQQAGPGFLHSMKREGLAMSVGALAMIVAGLLTALGCKAWFGFSKEITAGLFAGALTSTPGLAVALELAHDSAAPAAYGVAYTFGVVGVVLMVKLLPRLLRADIRQEEERLERELSSLHPQMEFTHLRVTNPNLCTGPLSQVLPARMAKVTITRVLRTGSQSPELAVAETVLNMNDTVRVVGTSEALHQAEVVIGPVVEADLAFNSVLIKKKILLSRPEVAGKTLRALNLSHVFGVQVSRITRNGFDCPAGANVRLRQGDVLHVVGHPETLENVKKMLGDDVRALFATSVAVLLTGLFCGLVAGAVPLYLPGLGIFTLGSTGGVLLAGLVFGAVRQVGPVITELPATTNALIRDLGLGLFLAVVGTAAGGTLVPTLQEYGLPLFLGGAIMTLVPMLTGVLLCFKALRISFLRMLGVVTGGMTSTPGLAAAAALSDTSYAATSYATVYPVALVGMIVASKIIMLVG